MATTPMSNSPAVVIDANVLIALCAREQDKYAEARARWRFYTNNGYEFFAPGVIVAEALFVLCRKLADGRITQADHAKAIRSLRTYLKAFSLLPSGDKSLAERAEQIRGAYGCSHSADGLYIALAEELAQTRTTELVTFDGGLQKQAAANAPSVTITLLIP